jgi:squalene-associated FAD-dependent desaturase
VGAGLAGLAAACELADRGFAVTLLERRPFAGGKTYSFVDDETGAEVDNGQHVVLRCCTAYTDFLRRLGTLEGIRWQSALDVTVLGSGGRSARLAARPRLPAPLHLLPALLAYRHLSPGQRVRAAWGALHMLRTEEETPGLDDEPFGDWLRRHGQSADVVRKLWDVIITATMNAHCAEVSTAAALMVLRTALLGSADAGAIGVPRVGLSSLHVEPALRELRRRDARIITRAGVQALRVEDGRATGMALADGAVLDADAYVIATPPTALAALLHQPWRRHPLFERTNRIRSAPIVNAHLWFERPITHLPFLAFLNDDLQWAFNTSLLRDEEGTGQHLTLSLSAAQPYLHLAKKEIVERLTAALGRFFPAARDNRLIRAVVIKEPEATFVPGPGVGRLRPGPVTPIENVFLAGAWTDTGWPATMESAVRSATACAQAVSKYLTAVGPPVPMAVPA